MDLRNDWLIRATKELIRNTPPEKMWQRFGPPFNGTTTSNAVAIYDPDLTAVQGWHERYWVITGDVVTLMDQAGRDAVDALLLDGERNTTADTFDDTEALTRALALSLLDAVNFLSDQVESMKAAILGANNLSSLQTAIGQIATAPQRTPADLKALLRSKLGT